jgi:hypothetical protein
VCNTEMNATEVCEMRRRARAEGNSEDGDTVGWLCTVVLAYAQGALLACVCCAGSRARRNARGMRAVSVEYRRADANAADRLAGLFVGAGGSSALRDSGSGGCGSGWSVSCAAICSEDAEVLGKTE